MVWAMVRLSAASRISSTDHPSARRASSTSDVCSTVSADDTFVRSSPCGGAVMSASAGRSVALFELSSQKSRVSRTAGCVARAAERSDQSRHDVVVGGSEISWPAMRCVNAVKMSAIRISRDVLSATISCSDSAR